ncbi:MAG TPA: 16S rRNA (cytosine(967)-C(5))-methyltransferase RsmB [Casimicrobiaceae bacterium]|nr:16S rRNA (cytosine(967)-C(5))-methyltransferase RsmB [Casimicrobiaceae bacterium]
MQHEQAQAARAVASVLQGSALGAALAAVDDGAATRGRALVQELAYGTLRHLGTLTAIVDRLATRPITDAPVRMLIAVALYQIGHTHAPAFAIVDRAVEAATLLDAPAARGLVNALLRRYLRERAAIEAAVLEDPVARWSHPAWWIERVQRDHRAQWQEILAGGNVRPPLTLRVNARRTTREALLATLRTADVEAHAEGAAGIIVAQPRPVTELPGYGQGDFAVQDLGAQLAAPLLDVHDGMRVLDACAAPGGKATHLAEIAAAEILALDVDASRLARIRANIVRLGHDRDGARIDVRQGDAADPAPWWSGVPFDRILADVPCTASGVVRRHPDGKWLRRASDVATFAATQDRILAALWPLLAPGGKLLYVTCSVFAEENEARVDAFVAAHTGALREPLIFPAGVVHTGGQLLPSTQPGGHNQDGFYYALLRKA